jgi:hypothetical protein
MEQNGILWDILIFKACSVPETALTSMHIHEPERMDNGGRAYFASANYARSGVVARGSGLSPVIMK